MKKTVLAIALAAFALAGNAQVLKSDFMKGYKEGDALEKSVYNEKKAPIRMDTWCGAFSSKPNTFPCPKAGSGLAYEGYAEKGASIVFGGFPAGQKGARFSVYSIAEGKEYGRGVYYLSFLVNFSKLGGSGLADFVGVSPNYTGGGNRSNVYVCREGGDRIRFGVSLLKNRAETTEAFDYDKTHLLVLKLDYDNQRTHAAGVGDEGGDLQRKSPMELLEEFYELQNGQPMGQEQRQFARQLMERIWEGDV